MAPLWYVNSERMKKKNARWCCSTKISKTNLKSMISPLLTRPKGGQGCQKIRKGLRFGPNWIKFEKPSKSRVSLTIFVQFWLKLSTPTYQIGLQFGRLDLCHPCHPWERETNFGHLDHCAVIMLYCTLAWTSLIFSHNSSNSNFLLNQGPTYH